MPLDKRRNKKLPDYLQSSEIIVNNQYYGTYIGVVRKTIDTQRLGRLLVFVPTISPVDQEVNWITVSYASPFYGFTDPNYNHDDPNHEIAEQLGNNTFKSTKHSYGMWFVPPDPGVKVLVTFVNGDLNKGYWFGCIPEGHSHHMVPSLGGAAESDFKTDTGVLSGANRPDKVPVVEYNVNDPNIKKDKISEWTQIEKPLHQEQFKILKSQGLEFDYYRGTVNSGSQRDMPSSTFGISTPGRPQPDPAFLAGIQGKIVSGSITENELIPKYRKGGHTFVMDDGDILGNDNFFRIRTGGGHQIMMHDTGKFIYISNSSGTAWIELNEKGDIEIFSGGSFSLRAADTLNLHSDTDINMYAGGKFNIVSEDTMAIDTKAFTLRGSDTIHMSSPQEFLIKSGASLKLEATSRFSAKAGGVSAISGTKIQLQGTTDSVSDVPATPRNNFPNSINQSSGYRIQQNRIKSIATRVPTHEPDGGHTAIVKQAGNSNALVATSPTRTDGRVPAITTNPTLAYGKSSTTDATKGIASNPKLKNLSAYLAKQPDPSGTIPGMTKDETKALLTGIGASESSGNYQAVNQYNYIGKYQFGAGALTDQGFIKPEYYQKYKGSNAVLDDPNAWTGASGISSKEEFLNNPDVQEQVMLNQAQSNYKTMLKSGAIRPDDDPATIGGMIQTAHLLGASGAAKWRATGQGQDANNVTGGTYFNKGKYSISSLTIDGVLKA